MQGMPHSELGVCVCVGTKIILRAMGLIGVVVMDLSMVQYTPECILL